MRLEVEVVHVVSDPELVLCLVSTAVVVEVKLRLSRSSVRSSALGSMVEAAVVVMERMVVGSGSDNWGLGMRVWRERELRF
jgi:hypothetical protein